jgi:hypothetical protein
MAWKPSVDSSVNVVDTLRAEAAESVKSEELQHWLFSFTGVCRFVHFQISKNIKIDNLQTLPPAAPAREL